MPIQTRLVTAGLAALLLGSFSLPAMAATPAHCDAQARELTQQAGRDIFTGMAAEQRAALQKLAAEVCAKHSDNPALQTQAAEADGNSSDWFTQGILRGEPADKPGNKRLQRLGR